MITLKRFLDDQFYYLILHDIIDHLKAILSVCFVLFKFKFKSVILCTKLLYNNIRLDLEIV